MRTLSITISDELYNNLKHNVASQKISKFVSEAVSEKLTKKTEALYHSYLEASQDTDRETELKDWEAMSIESWEHGRADDDYQH